MKKRDGFVYTAFNYVKTKRNTLLMLLLFSAVFGFVMYLYRIETEATLYAAALCLFFSAVYGFIDFILYYKRHRDMRLVLASVLTSLDGMPRPRDLCERDYDALVRELYAHKNELERRARAAEDDSRDYYARWVHQIKTPISAMRLLLADGQADLSALSSELLKIEQYVDMVLGYQRLSSEQSDLKLGRFRVDDIIKSSVKRFAPLFIQKKLSLVYEGTELTALTDRKWLEFAIEQLLSNSLKYTRRGEIRISTEGSKIVIEDSGIGISPEDIPRICQKGYTGYNGRGDERATGLGLYLCSSTLKKLGHSLEITSQPDVGTRAVIDLKEAELEVE